MSSPNPLSPPKAASSWDEYERLRNHSLTQSSARRAYRQATRVQEGGYSPSVVWKRRTREEVVETLKKEAQGIGKSPNPNDINGVMIGEGDGKDNEEVKGSVFTLSDVSKRGGVVDKYTKQTPPSPPSPSFIGKSVRTMMYLGLFMFVLGFMFVLHAVLSHETVISSTLDVERVVYEYLKHLTYIGHDNMGGGGVDKKGEGGATSLAWGVWESMVGGGEVEEEEGMVEQAWKLARYYTGWDEGGENGEL